MMRFLGAIESGRAYRKGLDNCKVLRITLAYVD